MPGHGDDNDWPEEIKGLRRIPKADAEKLSHGVPEADPDTDKAEHRHQLDIDHRHPAARFRDRDDD